MLVGGVVIFVVVNVSRNYSEFRAVRNKVERYAPEMDALDLKPSVPLTPKREDNVPGEFSNPGRAR